MTQDRQHMKVEVFREDDHWVAVPVGLPGSMSGNTLAELFAEVECHKYFCADVPEDYPLPVEYVAGQSEIVGQLRAAHEALLALPPNLWPRAVEWDPDSNRPVDPSFTTPYLNLEYFPITY